jgi:AraC-like DNA-binding protein
LTALWQEIARQSGRDDVGLQMAARADVGHFDVIGYIVASSPNLKTAWNRMMKYGQALDETAVWNLESERTLTRLSYSSPDVHHNLPAVTEQWMIGNLVRGSRELTGTNFPLVSVGFRHSPPRHQGTYQHLFRCPVKFNQPLNFVQIDSPILDLPMLKADSALCSVLARYAENLMLQSGPSVGLLERVRRTLCEALLAGDSRAEVVAERMGIGPRTLQRQLREVGTSYKEILEEIRKQLSIQYLKQSTLAVCEVAFLLGFSETSSFHRAFKRWTGQSPSDFRRADVRAVNTM